MIASPERPLAAPDRAARRQRRAFIAAAALVLALHGLLIGGTPGPRMPAAEPAAGPAFSVRTLALEIPAPATVPEPAPPPAPEPAAPAPPPATPAVAAGPAIPLRPVVRSRPRGLQTITEPAQIASAPKPAVEASARSLESTAEAPAHAAAAVAGPIAAAVDATPAVARAGSGGPGDPGASAASPLLAAGEVPPPTYRHRLPPPATLRYEVRRGFLRGTGEMRWRPADGGYELAFEARIGGVTLISQTSEGRIDAAGLAPTRFLDRRARRQAQAANFQRDRGRITFSGPSTEWPLLAGSQDRLSWMMQLAAIVSAEPERLVEGGRISMVVVGARGDAAVWTLRYAGREGVDTAAGAVQAAKFVRDARSPHDTIAEIWLDPARDWLPVHATLRSASGSSEYDLLLESVGPP